jgi:endoglucanase
MLGRDLFRRSVYLAASVTCIVCAQACSPSSLVTADGSTASGGAANVGGTPGGGTGAQAGQSGGAGSGGAPSDGTGGQVSGAGGAQNTGGGSGGGLVVGEHPTALEAAQAMGRGVNLGQMFESTQHPRTLEAASAKIDAYYARGFRTLRIPITWTEVIDGDLLVTDATTGEVNREHPRLAVIESVVDYALSKPDLFVVINAHHEVALKTESRSAVLERLWQDIADIFADRGQRLLFEILNEPHRGDDSAMPAADLRLMTGLAYDKIRAVDAERIVLFGGNQWFGANEVPTVWTSLDEVGGGADPYVMATFHHYDPWTFCGSEQAPYDDAWTDANQSDPMETMANWASTVGGGVPVFIGEWGVGWASGVQTTLTCNNIRQWYTTFHSQYASENGIPTAVWDDGGWFKIFDHGTGAFDNNLIDCILGSCEWDGTERMNAGCL